MSLTRKFFIGVDLDGTHSYTANFWPSGAFKSIVRPPSYKYITIGITTTGGLETLVTDDADKTEVSIARWWAELRDSKQMMNQMLDYQVQLMSRELFNNAMDAVCDELSK